MRQFKHFTWDDRLRLETMLRDGISKKDIAVRLEFDLSSIYREIDRGKYQHKKTDWTFEERYSADIADRKYRENLAAKGAELKIGKDRAFAEYIERKIIDEKYSPAAALMDIARSGLNASILAIALSSIFSDLENTKKQLEIDRDRLIESSVKYEKTAQEFRSIKAEYDLLIARYQLKEITYDEYREGLKQLDERVKAASGAIGIMRRGLSDLDVSISLAEAGCNDYTKKFEKNQSALDDVGKSIENVGEKQKLVNKYLSDASDVAEDMPKPVNKFSEAAKSAAKALEKLYAAYKAGEIDTKKYKRSLEEMLPAIEALAAGGDALAPIFVNLAQSIRSELAEAPATLDDLRAATKSLSGEVEMLNSALGEQEKNQTLSYSTAMKLIDAGYAAALQIDAETGAVTVNAEAYKVLLQAKIDEQRISLQQKRDAIIAQLGNETIEAAKAGAAYAFLASEKKAAMDAEIAEYDTQLKLLETMLNNAGKIASSSAASASASASASIYKNKLLDDELAKLEHLKKTSEVKTEDEIAEIERIKAAYTKNQKEIKEIDDLDERLYALRKKRREDDIKDADDKYRRAVKEAEERYMWHTRLLQSQQKNRRVV